MLRAASSVPFTDRALLLRWVAALYILVTQLLLGAWSSSVATVLSFIAALKSSNNSGQNKGLPVGVTSAGTARRPAGRKGLASRGNTMPWMSAEDGVSALTTADVGVQHDLPRASGRFAYVTLLTRDGYLPGVQCLARSLRRVGSQYPLVVIHTDTLSAAACEALRAEGCTLHLVDRFTPDGEDSSKYKLALYAECWNKLWMWELEQYDRCVYLDADMAVLRNVDALFSLPSHFYAVGDCYAGRKTQQERDACPLFSHGGRPAYFNAGLFVMSPSRRVFLDMQRQLRTGAIKTGGFAEQDFLNEYYASDWQPLPCILNAQKGIIHHHPHMWHLPSIAILHYTDVKPWQRDHPDNVPYADIVQLWWSIFEGTASPPNLPVSAVKMLSCSGGCTPIAAPQQTLAGFVAQEAAPHLAPVILQGRVAAAAVSL